MKKPKIDLRFRADDPQKDGRAFRSAEWRVETREVGEGEDKKTERVVRCSISSETPYARYMADPESGEWVKALEVLGHGPGEIDDTRMRDGLVIQDDPYGDQIGIMDKPEVKDGKISLSMKDVEDAQPAEKVQEEHVEYKSGGEVTTSLGDLIRAAMEGK